MSRAYRARERIASRRQDPQPRKNTTMQTNRNETTDPLLEAPPPGQRDPFDQADVAGASDEELAAMADGGRKLIAACEAHAAELERDAAGAKAAFEAKPTSEAVTKREVCAQLARNARAELQHLVEASAPLFAEEKRRAQIKRLAELRPLDAEAATKRIAVDVLELFETFSAGLEAKLAELGQAVSAYEDVRGEYSQLQSIYGDKRERRRIWFHDAIEQVRQRMAAHAPEWDMHGGRGLYLAVGDIGSEQGRQVTARVVFPMDSLKLGRG
jgi:hypothetical protein